MSLGDKSQRGAGTGAGWWYDMMSLVTLTGELKSTQLAFHNPGFHLPTKLDLCPFLR